MGIKLSVSVEEACGDPVWKRIGVYPYPAVKNAVRAAEACSTDFIYQANIFMEHYTETKTAIHNAKANYDDKTHASLLLDRIVGYMQKEIISHLKKCGAVFKEK